MFGPILSLRSELDLKWCTNFFVPSFLIRFRFSCTYEKSLWSLYFWCCCNILELLCVAHQVIQNLRICKRTKGFERSAPRRNIISVEDRSGSSRDSRVKQSSHALTAATRPWSRYYTSITRVSWPPHAGNRDAPWTHVHVTVPVSHPGQEAGLSRLRSIWLDNFEGNVSETFIIFALWTLVIPTMESLMWKTQAGVMAGESGCSHQCPVETFFFFFLPAPEAQLLFELRQDENQLSTVLLISPTPTYFCVCVSAVRGETHFLQMFCVKTSPSGATG